MSLLSYASPWTSDNAEGTSRKRVPTLGGLQNAARKTVKIRPAVEEDYEQYGPAELSDEKKVTMRGSESPESISEYLEKQTDRNTKINSVLNKITGFSTNDKLGDFNPMPYPSTVSKKNSDKILPEDESVDSASNPLMPKLSNPTFDKSVKSNMYYRPSESNGPKYSNYRDAYGKEGWTTQKEPYYAKMGIGKGESLSGDKMMERLNYITQILESLQMEKTNHVTEEFLLYSLLGVFMIYIVDGFSRGGKYVR